MSELLPVTPLNGATFTGYATIRALPPFGMITLRVDAGTPELAAAIYAATGCTVPDVRQILPKGERHVAWMSPDEYLLIMPYGDVPAALQALDAHLAGVHHLAVDVSSARAAFAIEGPALSVLAKLTPTDLAELRPFQMRRTRLAQVAAAFWIDSHGATVICFASVAQYMFDLLSNAARTGSEI